MSVLQNKSLNVKLVSNKQGDRERERERGAIVVNSSLFTQFICNNGSEAFVPVWSTRRTFAEVPLRLDVGLLFYPAVVVETILLLQVHSHYNIKKNIPFLCLVIHHTQNNFKEKLSMSIRFIRTGKDCSESSLAEDV